MDAGADRKPEKSSCKNGSVESTGKAAVVATGVGVAGMKLLESRNGSAVGVYVDAKNGSNATAGAAMLGILIGVSFNKSYVGSDLMGILGVLIGCLAGIEAVGVGVLVDF